MNPVPRPALVANATREAALTRMARQPFDVLVIGGGITGAAIAHRAASANLRVALVDKGDFASGTSSRSSRLIHGGLRYLKYGHVRLVRRSQREQERMAQHAPHLVKPLPMLLPLYRHTSTNVGVVSFGMLLYRGLQPLSTKHHHGFVSARNLLAEEPLLPTKGLLGGFVCREFLTHDARLVWENVLAAMQHGGCAANYVRLQEFLISGARVSGAMLRDELTGKTIEVQAGVVVNATGAWSDDVTNAKSLRLSKGVHIFLPRHRLPLRRAMILFSPRDARPIVAIPNENFVMVGPTETEFNGPPNGVRVEREDIAYLLETLNEFFPALALGEADVIDSRAGLRALCDPAAKNAGRLSREYHIEWQRDGLLSVLGGKLTLHRLAAEETFRFLQPQMKSVRQSSADQSLSLPGAVWARDPSDVVNRLRRTGACDASIDHLIRTYGSRADLFAGLISEDAGLGNQITPRLPHVFAEAAFAARHEMAACADDFLERRSDLALCAKSERVDAAALVSRFWQAEPIGMAASA